ncbi:MAG: hypothetical protein AAB512_05195, partial [Patescibacteria group bacterium]
MLQMPVSKNHTWHRKLSLLLLFLTFSIFNFQFSTSSALAAPGDPPAPKPCFNPVPAYITDTNGNYVLDAKGQKAENLTDNYIVTDKDDPATTGDDSGDPPGPVDIDGTPDNPDALKFTVIRSAPIGTKVVDINKHYTFTVDFSKLQAIFGAPNSDFNEGYFQSQTHAAQDLMKLDTAQLLNFQRATDKAGLKVMTDGLREKYVNYVFDKPEIAESEMKFADYEGKFPKTVHQLVKDFGQPDPPEAGTNDPTWNSTWGKYWEKLPTAYNEFYIGKLEFRPVHGVRAIEALKRGDPGACFPNPSIRTVEFPVPNFFRTAATTGVLNQTIVPKAAQSDQNALINIKGTILGVKTTTSNFFLNCFKFAKNNPVSNIIKKAVKVSLETLNPAKVVYAAPNCTLNKSSVAQGGTIRVTSHEGLSGTIGMQGAFGTPVFSALGNLPANGSATITVPAGATLGLYVVRVGGFGVPCSPDIEVTAPPPPPPPPPPTCSLNKSALTAGDTVTVSSQNGLSGAIQIAGVFWPIGTPSIFLGNLPANGTLTPTIPTSFASGQYAIRVGLFAALCGTLDVTALVPGCTISPPTTVRPGQFITVSSQNSLSGEIRIAGAFWPVGTPSVYLGVDLPANGTIQATIPIGTLGGLYAVRVGGFAVNCGDITVDDKFVLNAPTIDPNDSEIVTFTFTPAGDNLLTLIIYDATGAEVWTSGATLNNKTTVVWTTARWGKNYVAVLNKGLNDFSNRVTFDVPYVLKPPVQNGRDIIFNWTPPIHLGPPSTHRMAIIVDRIDVNPSQFAWDSLALPLNSKTTTWRRVPPGQYEACIKFDGVRELDTHEQNCEIFTVTFIYPWTVFDLHPESCIKVSTAGKAGNAPYCAIYPTKFEPGHTTEPNILGTDSCTNQTDQYKLNDQQNVKCTFAFDWHSRDYDLVIPATGNGNWDECGEVSGNSRTCYLTVGVWPDFRIPYLCQIENNALYSDVNEHCPTLQETGRPGVYSFFMPKAMQEGLGEDPLQRMIDSCASSPSDGVHIPVGCEPMLNYGNDHAAEIPGYSACVGAALLNIPALIACFDSVTRTLIDNKLPGEVNSTGPGVAGASIGPGGQVLGEVTGNQKERFIGAVECKKHDARDISLKPKVQQDDLGIPQRCDLTASTDATKPGTPPG